jgi:hypothetical protein
VQARRDRQRQNSRQDYGRARPSGNRDAARVVSGWCSGRCLAGVRRGSVSLLACPLRATMVVHTMWTNMWNSHRRQRGGAGERP